MKRPNKHIETLKKFELPKTLLIRWGGGGGGGGVEMPLFFIRLLIEKKYCQSLLNMSMVEILL